MTQAEQTESQKVLNRIFTATQPPAETSLEDIIRRAVHPGVPKIGQNMADDMIRVHEKTAATIEMVAQSEVDRALAMQKEAQALADMLREAGQKLAGRMAAEATRAYRLDAILHHASEALWAETDKGPVMRVAPVQTPEPVEADSTG